MTVFVGRANAEMTATLLIQQRSEQEAAIEPRKTHPFDIRHHVDISQVRTVAYDTHVVFVNRHNFLSVVC
jgi:hypothetical protein